MLRKGVTIVLMLLFVGFSIIPSTSNIVKNTHSNSDNFNSFEKIFECSHPAYIGSNSFDCGLYEFTLNDPGNLTCICPDGGPSANFISGSTWTAEDIWLGCQYDTGALWEIHPETCEMSNIGGGGTSCNSLAWDVASHRLYGASSTHLIEYDPDTGEQEVIGSFGLSGKTIIGIAIDVEGRAFIWDVLFSGSSTLWEVDLGTAEATAVGLLGLTLTYAQDGDFCKEDNTLYLATYTTYPNVGYFLYECDVETGSCSLIGEFQEEVGVSLFVIPLTCCNSPPITTISFDPPTPDGDNGWYVSNVTVTLNATDDDGVNATNYRINNGEWRIYESPFILSEDGENIFIEYYSVDTVGNIEEVKSETIDIDKTPPNVDGFEWVSYKENCTWYIDFNFNITDETSGLDRIEFFINDGHHETIMGGGPTYIFTIVWLEELRKTVFWFYCYDMAGNMAVLRINGSDITSHPSFHNYQFLFQNRLERFPLLQRLLSLPIFERLLIK